jgi:HSP20 family protein
MTTLRAWSPALTAVSVHRALDRLSDGAGETAFGTRRPAYDLYETPQEFVVRAWLPGITPNELDITFERGVLTIMASAPAPETPTEGVIWHHRELSQTNWKLAFRLPRDLYAEAADATYEHGVLTLRLPKAESAKPRTIHVRTTV